MTVQIEATADARFGTNSYLVVDDETSDAVVIDAHLEPELIVEAARRRRVRPRAILLTHSDLDHIAGLTRLREEFGMIPIAVHDAEREQITAGTPLRPMLRAESAAFDNVDRLVAGEVYRAGSLEFDVLHTPGHSPGGVTLRIGNALFTGDALFAGSIGRSDFPNSDGSALLEGIRTQLMSHGDDYVVLSGHGPMSTIGQERRYNPFLQP